MGTHPRRRFAELPRMLNTRLTGWQEPRRVQDESQLRGHVNKCCKQWIEHARGRQSDAECINTQSTEEIGPDDSPGAPREEERVGKFRQIVTEQHHIGALPGHIRSGAHGNSDLRFDQRRSVVDSIANHRDDAPFERQTLDSVALVLGQQVGGNLGDAELRGDLIGDRPRISRQQHGPQAQRMNSRNGRARLGTNSIGDLDGTEQLPGARNIDFG